MIRTGSAYTVLMPNLQDMDSTQETGVHRLYSGDRSTQLALLGRLEYTDSTRETGVHRLYSGDKRTSLSYEELYTVGVQSSSSPPHAARP